MIILEIQNILGISLFASLLFYFYTNYRIYTSISEKKEESTQPSSNEIYLKNVKEAFIKCFENDIYNRNIQPEFYDKEQYNELIIRKNNKLDTTWKSRILFENTPQGMVIMFYNAYKYGFSYYSDNNISYPFLNAVAMKYASKFYCRDFFIDDSVIPDDHTSPFLHIHEIDVMEKTEKKEKAETKIDVNKGPFAKFKKYDKPKPKLIDIKKEPDMKTTIKNKFLYLGKIYKFTPLQKNINKPAINNQIKDPIPIKYSSYKQWHNPERFELIPTS